MIKALVKDLDEDEMKVMIKCLLHLNEFFEGYENRQTQQELSVYHYGAYNELYGRNKVLNTITI